MKHAVLYGLVDVLASSSFLFALTLLTFYVLYHSKHIYVLYCTPLNMYMFCATLNMYMFCITLNIFMFCTTLNIYMFYTVPLYVKGDSGKTFLKEFQYSS